MDYMIRLYKCFCGAELVGEFRNMKTEICFTCPSCKLPNFMTIWISVDSNSLESIYSRIDDYELSVGYGDNCDYIRLDKYPNTQIVSPSNMIFLSENLKIEIDLYNLKSEIPKLIKKISGLKSFV